MHIRHAYKACLLELFEELGHIEHSDHPDHFHWEAPGREGERGTYKAWIYDIQLHIRHTYKACIRIYTYTLGEAVGAACTYAYTHMYHIYTHTFSYMHIYTHIYTYIHIHTWRGRRR